MGVAAREGTLATPRTRRRSNAPPTPSSTLSEILMSLDEYQRAARRTVNPALSGIDRLADAVAGLAEESGETLGHVRQHLYQGRPLDHDALREELGDALWCLAAAAGAAGMSLEDVARANLEKLHQRWPERRDPDAGG